MIWIPPPYWFIAFAVALIAHTVVIGVVFYTRGWKRGLLAIPLAFVLYILSVVGGVALDIRVGQLDPLPLLVVLAVGVYGVYALMMWKPRRLSGEQAHVS
jgi:uncharacterized membrane protein YfcA